MDGWMDGWMVIGSWRLREGFRGISRQLWHNGIHYAVGSMWVDSFLWSPIFRVGIIWQLSTPGSRKQLECSVVEVQVHSIQP